MRIIAGIPAYNKQYPVCGVIHAAGEYVNEVSFTHDHKEMIAIAESNGFKTIEVPITEIYTEDGSTLNP
jgi:hypothetical protein